MNYAKIIPYDFANGEGVRTSLFVSGCTNHCPGCFNPEQQDFNYGKPFGSDALLSLQCMLSSPVISGLSILGGDPLCQDSYGIAQLIELCRDVKAINKSVWLWTGFTWEDVFGEGNYRDLSCTNTREDDQRALLRNCDVVVDGPFIESMADRTLLWRGSANQRLIDVKKTLDCNEIINYLGGNIHGTGREI